MDYTSVSMMTKRFEKKTDTDKEILEILQKKMCEIIYYFVYAKTMMPLFLLCEQLLNEDNDVLRVDNFFTSTKQNILHILSDPHFELMRHDITFPLYVEVDEI